MLTTDRSTAEQYLARRRDLADAGVDEKVAYIAGLATQIRLWDLEMINRAKLGHIGGDFSVADILATLYGAVLNVDPTNPTDPERDRFVLSKGHTAGALYSTLASCGFFAAGRTRDVRQPLVRR